MVIKGYFIWERFITLWCIIRILLIGSLTIGTNIRVKIYTCIARAQDLTTPLTCV